MKSYSLLLAALILVGCGRSGTWTDDPKNWQRAFRSRKPDGVTVVHSKYWRSPHWTYEFEYFFHIKANHALQQQLLESNNLIRVEGTEAVQNGLMPFPEKPAWFVPGSPVKYDVWKYPKEPHNDFRVFIEKESRDLFMADKQL